MTSDPEPGARWFYVEDGRRRGPVGVPELVELILGGRIAEDTLVWRSGLEAWVPAESLEEVRRELPPPIPGEEDPEEREDARAVAERLAGAEEGPGAEEGEAAAPSPGPGRRKRRRHRHRPARPRPRWLVPLVVMVVVVIVVIWYLLRRINEVPPGQIILQGSLAAPVSPGRPGRLLA